MKNIKLGKSINASKIAYGCMRIGNKSEKEAVNAVRTAYECSINFFDNADIYCGGLSEEYFGKAVKQIGRDNVIIQSKCAIRNGFYDFSKDYIISACEKSLKRIGTDYLDVLCLHRPDVLMQDEEVAEAFVNLKSRGLVKNFGVSNCTPMQIELLKKYVNEELIVNQLQLGVFHTGMIDSWLCANMDNNFAVDKDGSVLAYSMLNDMTVQAWGPMRSKGGFFPCDSSVSDKMPVFKKWAEKYGLSKEAFSIAFINRLNIVQPIIGTTNPNRIRDLLKCSDICIEREDWYKFYAEMGNLVP